MFQDWIIITHVCAVEGCTRFLNYPFFLLGNDRHFQFDQMSGVFKSEEPLHSCKKDDLCGLDKDHQELLDCTFGL